MSSLFIGKDFSSGNFYSFTELVGVTPCPLPQADPSHLAVQPRAGNPCFPAGFSGPATLAVPSRDSPDESDSLFNSFSNLFLKEKVSLGCYQALTANLLPANRPF